MYFIKIKPHARKNTADYSPKKLTSRMPMDLTLNQTCLRDIVAWNTKTMTFWPGTSGNLEFRTTSLPNFEGSTHSQSPSRTCFPLFQVLPMVPWTQLRVPPVLPTTWKDCFSHCYLPQILPSRVSLKANSFTILSQFFSIEHYNPFWISEGLCLNITQNTTLFCSSLFFRIGTVLSISTPWNTMEKREGLLRKTRLRWTVTCPRSNSQRWKESNLNARPQTLTKSMFFLPYHSMLPTLYPLWQ